MNAAQTLLDNMADEEATLNNAYMDASNAFWEAVESNYEAQVGVKDWEAA